MIDDNVACLSGETFLHRVAEDLLHRFTSLADVCVVFPNKRASLFLNDYLAKMGPLPLWLPRCMTVSELFQQQTDVVVADELKLVCDLYASFCRHTDLAETMDQFYDWGQLLLQDFNDIDQQLADANQVFTNLKNLHELDGAAHLTEEQKCALREFFANFRDDIDTQLKKKFLNLWSHFGDIYHDFNQRLAEQHLAYSGALCRQVAESKQLRLDKKVYVFVGFNLLSEAEKRLFQRIQRERETLFYWDYDHSYRQLCDREGSPHVRENLNLFPNALPNDDESLYNTFVQPKRITYVQAMSDHIQARFVDQWLRQNNEGAPQASAIVLADETLLPTVLHSIPPQEGLDLNVTIGYPLSLSTTATFISLLLTLRNSGRRNNDTYRLPMVSRLLNHPFLRMLSPAGVVLAKQLQDNHRIFPRRHELTIDETLQQVFKAPAAEGSETLSWLIGLLKRVGNALTYFPDIDDRDFHQEAVFKMYTVINRLLTLTQSGDLVVQEETLHKLIRQLVQRTRIAFHGEPIADLQVMGILETRNLDFRRVLLLSAGEGHLPSNTSNASFIPFSLRKAFNLGTIDTQMATHAYYFYHLLARAQNVTLVYNAATEEGHTGEMSRFMLQLLAESPHAIHRVVLQNTSDSTMPTPTMQIEKTGDILQALNSIDSLSPTAINNYLRCPFLFYYKSVRHIKEPNDDEDGNIDNRTFGNIFHRAAELLCQQIGGQQQVMTREAIDQALKEESVVSRAVDQAFSEYVFGSETDYNGLQLINRRVIISYLTRMLRQDRRQAPVRLLGTEKKFHRTLTVTTSLGRREITTGGIIDRLDAIQTPQGERIRVVDYKTGRDSKSSIADIDGVFRRKDISKYHADYHLQSMLYATIVAHDREANPAAQPVGPALLFIQQAGADDYDPTIRIGREPVVDILKHQEAFDSHLADVVTEILEPTIPFTPTQDASICEKCAFSRLCGR